MSTQIAIRLPDDVVHELDKLVAAGHASSRADIVTRALRRDSRRRAAERDAQILAATGPSTDLDGLVEWTSHHSPTLD